MPLGEVGAAVASAPMEGVPFTYLAHLVFVPVRVGDVDAGFVLDTGIGLTLLSERLAREGDCVPNGETFTGQRMSGQEVGVALADGPPITVGALTREAQVVGVLDTSGFPPPLATVGGFLSLAFFDETAFTVDYPRRVVTLESPSTLAERRRAGRPSPSGSIGKGRRWSRSCRSRSAPSVRSRSRWTWAATF